MGLHLAQAAVTVAMVLSVDSLRALEALLVLRSALTALDYPARNGALRRVVPTDELLVANAFAGSSWSATYAVGMAAGGLLAAISPQVALIVDAATFAVAALLLTGLPAMPPLAGTSAGGLHWSHVRTLLRDHPALRYATFAKLPLAVAAGGAWVLLNLVSEDVAFAGTTAVTLGLLHAARGIGTGLGPIAADRLVARGRSHAAVWAVVVVAGLGGMAAFSVVASPVALVLAATVWGAGTGANWVLSTAQLQQRAPDGAVGRLSGVDALASTLGMGLGALGAGVLVEWTGTTAVAAWSTVAAGTLLWLALLAGSRGRRADRALAAVA